MRKILVSQCLYGGEPVRYDGKTKAETDPRFLKWKEEGRLLPVCPEVFGGLQVPRIDAQRQGDKVITRDGRDVTDAYMTGAHEAVRLAREENVVCAIMKEKSPSCGSHQIYDGSFDGTLIDGQGTAAELLKKAGIHVFSEKQLDQVEALLRPNIVMIGMPSCGKSVTGVVLAKILRMKFIDTDLLIQEEAGKSLQDIINEDGIDAFKRLEEQVLSELDVTNAVISTGGSAIYYHDAMMHLKESGTVVYLEASLETIKRRLRNIRTRGVAMGKGQTLDDLYNLRVPLYEKYADLTVETGAGSMEDTVESIMDMIYDNKVRNHVDLI